MSLSKNNNFATIQPQNTAAKTVAPATKLAAPVITVPEVKQPQVKLTMNEPAIKEVAKSIKNSVSAENE